MSIPSNFHRRVVITGLGAITPLGNSPGEFWQSLLAGRSGIGPITHFDASRHECRIAGEVKGFDPLDYLDRKDVKRTDRFVHLALAATQQALEDAQFRITDLNAEQVGVILGTGIGGIRVLEEQQTIYLQKGPDRCSPFMVPMMIANMAAGHVAIRFGAKGPNSCTVTACASGSNAIGDAFRLIQRGEVQVAITGGTEAAVTPLSVAGFSAMKALSTRNDAPEQACRPFDRDRDGFVMGEGAGILLLEELEHARSRGAKIYAEIVGYGLTCDAHHITNPAPAGEGAARAMRLALKDAGIRPDQVQHINAHATSTPVGDVAEVQAIRAVFGEHAPRLAISATKSMTGHLLGGAGGIATVATALAIHHGWVPPTLNLDNLDPECEGLDFVPHRARQMAVDVALVNAFGFGGHNVTLALRRYSSN
ncbi:3-oxoacyl-ACP synthase [Synechococcus sp. 60AY4M2]|jgi:3-oxoacyl-[acyl-carrier-protein] synthase II|uniref:beta-ketoacyl-ACP synthase II n=1 Tax=unclassified Synechococcus TaxID=2626047 RepID=UPI000C19040A|nr:MULTISPECIES: beta-ketoacyl-ACP synthase II [unclassified Synechococcus]PIK95331.1 3-oxoacyl-ACP synthase [Synechococcus sp. 60AY4M2]PIL01705.1 3-oxoacyl-ACP synthase [Synechococcus sp. 65AY640]